MYRLLLPIFFAASALAAGPVPLPSNFQRCSRNDQEINKCLKPVIQAAVIELVKGSRPLGVLPIDPLQIVTLGIHQGTGPVAINLDFTDLAIIGLKDIEVESVDAQLNGDVKSLTLKLSSSKSLSLVGKYTVDGKVLVLPISGDGNSKIEFLGVDGSITLTGKVVKKGGHEYLTFQSVKLNLDPRDMKLRLENLFNGDKALGENMNTFLNENWREVYGELKDAVQKALGSTFIEIANRICSKVTFNDMFPQ